MAIGNFDKTETCIYLLVEGHCKSALQKRKILRILKMKSDANEIKMMATNVK